MCTESVSVPSAYSITFCVPVCKIAIRVTFAVATGGSETSRLIAYIEHLVNFIDLRLNLEECHLRVRNTKGTKWEQESPPAWTQEAYRPPRSKYTLCCSDWGYLLPPLSRSQVRMGGGYPHQEEWGTPFSQMGVHPSTGWRYPLLAGWGYPQSAGCR